MDVVGGQNGGVRTVDLPAKVGSASPRSRSIERSMYISLCGVDPQYKLPVSMLERLSHPVSQTGPFVIVGPTVPAQQKVVFLP